MADVIEIDVMAETVRCYMIDADIHVPRSYTSEPHSGNEESVSLQESTNDGDTTVVGDAENPESDTEQNRSE